VARRGIVSSLDPTCRLICLAFLSFASLLSGAVFAALLALAAIFLLLREGLRFRAILHDSAFIVSFTLFTAVLRFFGLSQSSGHRLWGAESSGLSLVMINDMGAYGLRLFAAFLAGRLFYASTTASEVRDAGTRLARYIPFIAQLDIGLYLSMVIGFIPLIFEEWRNALEAARARGMPRRPKLSMLSLFVTAFLRRLMLQAVATPEALVARGWTRDRGVAPSNWKMRDSIAALACGLTAISAVLRFV